MKKLRCLFFCFALSCYVAVGLLPTLQQQPETSIGVLEENTLPDIRKDT